MAEILTFSHCLNKLMQKHELTPNQLCACIGCTRSDIKQLLATEGTEAKRLSIFEKIKSCQIFLPEELWMLEQSLQISRIGLERSRFQHSIEHILAGHTSVHSPEMLSDDGKTLSSLLRDYQNADQVDILCMNSCYSAVMNALQPLFDDPQKQITMWHLISMEDTARRSAIYVALTLPLLFDKRYQPYGVSRPADLDNSPVGGNILAIRGRFNGKIRESYVCAINSSTFFELPDASACGMFQYTSNLFRAIRSTVTSLKENENPNEDFTSLCMTFLSHELNRATYSLANGLCFQQIPTSIAIEALNGADFFSEQEISELVERTFSIHEQRHQNLYNKRKPTYMIMTQQGCEQFLETGVNMDHFIGFRPFTPEERSIIFKLMLDSASRNPYYSPLLMKDPHFQHRINLECYDKLGVSLDAVNTDYNLQNGYRPIFLMFPEFTKQYLAYYLEVLVSEKCYSRETSLRILHEMYDSFLQKFNLKHEKGADTF